MYLIIFVYHFITAVTVKVLELGLVWYGKILVLSP